MPVADTMRIRSATGLKSTAIATPAGSASDSWLTFSQAPVFASTRTIAPSGVTPYSRPSAGRTSNPTSMAPPARPTDPTTFF